MHDPVFDKYFSGPKLFVSEIGEGTGAAALNCSALERVFMIAIYEGRTRGKHCNEKRRL
jgi:hypothetical protein